MPIFMYHDPPESYQHKVSNRMIEIITMGDNQDSDLKRKAWTASFFGCLLFWIAVGVLAYFCF
ncbi:YmiA family putative membrane protein [Lonsdalea quercina]|uniref:YmiA family putative membrane protein n=1 Tax=Lonsdalea quercina TaxID=71657 RepID=UPI0039758316